MERETREVPRIEYSPGTTLNIVPRIEYSPGTTLNIVPRIEYSPGTTLNIVPRIKYSQVPCVKSDLSSIRYSVHAYTEQVT